MQINAQKYEVNEETREITFSCCSENPCIRYDEQHDIEYEQILIINENTVDLSRLNNGAPLLFNHDTEKLIGIVQSAFILDEKVYIRVKFSANDELAERIYKDILDGTIKNVSIGYQIEHYKDAVEDGINKRYIDKFMIYQASIVSIPADVKVGIRKLNIKGENRMKKQCDKENLEQKENEVQKEVEQDQIIDEKDNELQELKAENEALKAEIEKMKLEKENEDKDEKEQTVQEEEIDAQQREEIEKIGQDFNVQKEQIERAIKDKLTIREFKQKIKSLNFKIKDDKKMIDSKREFQDFIKRGEFDKSFTLRDFTGFGGKTGEGGESLIGTQTLRLVPALQRLMGVRGFRTLSNLHYNVTIPVQTTRNTVYQADDLRSAVTTSNPAFTPVTLTPVKISGNTVIGKELLVQANEDVIAFVIDSLTKEIAYKLQDFMLGKVASANPTTITYDSLSAIDWSDILAFQAATAGYVLNAPSYVMSASARSYLKSIPKTQNFPDFLCSGDNKINGYDCNVSGCVSNNNIYFGDWSKLIVGFFGNQGGLQILVNPFKYSTQGNVEVVASVCVDAVIQHNGAFAIGKVNSSSTSSDSSSSL